MTRRGTVSYRPHALRKVSCLAQRTSSTESVDYTRPLGMNTNPNPPQPKDAFANDFLAGEIGQAPYSCSDVGSRDRACGGGFGYGKSFSRRRRARISDTNHAASIWLRVDSAFVGEGWSGRKSIEGGEHGLVSLASRTPSNYPSHLVILCFSRREQRREARGAARQGAAGRGAAWARFVSSFRRTLLIFQ